jgi:hypothetical protein
LLMMQLQWRWISTEWMWKDSKKQGTFDFSFMYTTLDLQELNNQMAKYVRLCFEDFVQCCLESSFSCSWSTIFTWWLATTLLYKWLAFHWGLAALHFLPNDALCVWISWSPIFSQQSLKHSKYLHDVLQDNGAPSGNFCFAHATTDDLWNPLVPGYAFARIWSHICPSFLSLNAEPRN